MKQEQTLVLDGLIIDADSRRVVNNGENIFLSGREFDILEFLARNANRVISRTTLLEYVWNYSAHTITNTVEVHMTALRKKLEKKCGHNPIENIYGIGYILKANRQISKPMTSIPSNT